MQTPVTPQAPRAVLYLRLSQADDASTSIARQEKDLRDRAEREGWDVVRVLIDDGISGALDRANAREALRMIRDGEADVLAVWKLDRWSRQGLTALADLIDALDAAPGSLFVADRDGLDSTQATWRIVAAVLSEVARIERENTSLRVRSAITALRKARRFSGGAVPYGYRPAPSADGPGRVLVIDADEAEIIREIADRVREGESPYRLARELNARGVPAPGSARRRRSRSGKTDPGQGIWRTTTVARMLTGDHLLGRVTHRGEVLRDADGLPVEVWEPILDLPTLNALRERLAPTPAEDGKPRGSRRKAARLLSGVAFCAVCGGKLYARTGSGGRARYRCSSEGGECSNPATTVALLDEYVTRLALDEIGDLERTTVEPVSTPDPATTTLAEIEEALRATAAAMMADDADIPALLARRSALLAKRAEARAAERRPTILWKIVGTGETYRQAFERAAAAGDVDAQREIILAALDRVKLSPATRRGPGFDPARVEIDWKPATDEDVAKMIA